MQKVQIRLEESRLAIFQDAARVQHSVVTAAEKRVLLWLAQRTPRSINSDHLTALGAAGMLMAGGSYALAPATRYAPLLACFFLAVNWLGDSLDGTLARWRNCQRPRYGFYVDHVIDCFGATALLGGMAASGYMSPLIALALLISYLLLAAEIFLATYALGRFQMSYFQLGPTELRILICIGNLYLFLHPAVHPFGWPLTLFDLGGLAGAAAMLAISILSFVRHTRILYNAERLA